MKFLFTVTLAFACLNLATLKAHPQPGNRLANLDETLESTAPISQTDDMPPELESEEFDHLLYKCLPKEDWILLESCVKETELKLNTTKPIKKIGASKADKDDFEKKNEKFDKLICECFLRNRGGVDEMTNQFNITNYIKDYESTSLSFKQKTLASTDFKSCITAGFITPSLPLLIRWTESSTKENEVTGNWLSVMHIIGCDILALIKNGCSDTSVSNSTLIWIINDVETRITKDRLR